jgi:hypothetical protein
MSKSLVPLLLILGSLALSSCRKSSRPEPPAAASGKLSGEYRITSASRPGGNRSVHAGTVTIEPAGSHYAVSWRLEAGQSYRGVGIEEGEFLAVGWGAAEDSGVAVYEIGGGQLKGRWAASNGGGKLGSEELRGPSALNGTYEIEDARSPAGDSYDGQLSLTPSGSIYRLIRRAGTTTYHGAAIKKAGRLFAGWDRGGGAVMVYTVKEGKLNGQWAQPSSSGLGTEFLTRR